MSAAATSPLGGNPFHLLNISTRDARDAIIDAAETAALTGDPKAIQEASATLTNPRKRLTAELAWLPGIAPAKAKAFLANLKPGASLPDGVSGLARVNLGSHLAALEAPECPDRCQYVIAALIEGFEQLSPGTILRQINEDREIAGLPQIADEAAVDAALADLRRQWVHGAVQMIDRVRPDVFRPALYELFDRAPHNDLSDDIADALALSMKAFLDEEANRAKILCDKLLELAPRAPHALTPLLDKLDELLANWEQTTRPLQVNAAARGIEHEESRKLAFDVRDAAVSLVNAHGLLEPAKQLTQSIDRHFRVMAEVKDHAAEDTQALARLTADFAQQQADDEAFAARMRYSVEIGTLFKKRVTMDTTQLTYEGKTIAFADATGLAWGAIIHSTNGVRTGTEYSVTLKDENGTIHISPKTEAVYGDLIERLYVSAGWIITLKMLSDVAAGGRFLFGDTVVTDEHIQIRPSGWVRKETINLPWSEAEIWSENGQLCVGRNGQRRALVSLSYKDVYNVHLLENIVRTVFKKGGSRLSDFR